MTGLQEKTADSKKHHRHSPTRIHLVNKSGYADLEGPAVLPNSNSNANRFVGSGTRDDSFFVGLASIVSEQ